ncbi:MAG: hypothetical protein H6799_00490 [Candidatus Nomurabacteria bacterium]|nr:MAG: hypothetical protein H6799_00490 [Candidatus Nomurabacteria bacterium]
MTEDFVIARARKFGITVDVLGGPIPVQEARDTMAILHPVSFDLRKVRRTHLAGTNQLFNVYLDNIDKHHGLGWFGDEIIENLGFPQL